VDGHVDLRGVADAILAAGWVRCLHKNRSGFSNGTGPWQMNCGDCGRRWAESTPDWRYRG